MRDLSVYIHIPFCMKKCRYCDFLSYPAEEEVQKEYVELLLAEIEGQAPFYKEHRVISVFIGGGTPSVLDDRDIEKMIRKLKSWYTFGNLVELTIEVNPGTVSKDKLTAYLRCGINRLSIGLQSTEEKELRMLGRIHDYPQFCRTYDLAREMGFRNINIDLMSAIPGQTVLSYTETLKKVLSHKPEHISAYSLILEEGTWFYEHQKELPFLTEDEDRALYELTGEILTTGGFHRYEISNYAKEGFECRHNKVYWKRGDYVGFGLGAASMVEEVRFSNPHSMEDYRRKVMEQSVCPEGSTIDGSGIEKDYISKLRTKNAETIQYLTTQEQMEEFMFLGLRLMEGVEKKAFENKFGILIENIYGETFARLQKDGLLEIDDFVRLTPYGIDVSNYVMSQFLFD